MRRPPLRAPFLVTVTAVAATFSSACGSSGGAAGAVTTDSGTSDTDTSETSNPAECPDALPSYGAACSKVMTCFYGPVDACGNRNGAACDGERWTFIGGTCNPPPPDCPPEPPILGSACDTYGWGGCSYPDKCGVEEGWLSYMCVSGRWGFANPGPDSACPAAEPVPGTDCRTCLGRLPETGCKYWSTDCPGVPLESYAFCDTKTGKWTVSISTCNPPPPDADAGSPPWP